MYVKVASAHSIFIHGALHCVALCYSGRGASTHFIINFEVLRNLAAAKGPQTRKYIVKMERGYVAMCW